MMKISIIIPTLNEAASIKKILLPLQALRQYGHEIILTDGGSRDETLAIAKPLVDKIVTGECGRAKQQNHGAAHAEGDWLFFLHADTLIPDNFLSILDSISKQKKLWGRFDVRLSGDHPYFRIIEKMMNIRSRLTHIATGDQLIFVKITTFQQIGGFPNISLMEDIEISRRLKSLSAPIIIPNPVVTSSKRWEKNGIIKTVLLMWWLRLNYFFGRDPRRLEQIYYRR